MNKMPRFVTFAANIITFLSVSSMFCVSAETSSTCINETLALFQDSGKGTLSGAYEAYFSNFSSICELETFSSVCNFTSLTDTVEKATSEINNVVNGIASGISSFFSGTAGNRNRKVLDSSLFDTITQGVNSVTETVTQGVNSNLLNEGLVYDGVMDLSRTDIVTIKDACAKESGKMCYVTVNTIVTGTFFTYPINITLMTVGLPACLGTSCEIADLSGVIGPIVDSQAAFINSTLESLNIQSGAFTQKYLNVTCA